MDSWISAALLGVVEGLTEFLPISSTGHLILANSLLGLSGQKIATFDVIIQLGAILAVVVLYRRRFLGLVAPSLVQTDQDQSGLNGFAPPSSSQFAGIRGLFLLFLTSLPAALLGLASHDLIKSNLFGPISVAWALGAGAIIILVIETVRPKSRYASLDDITPLLALGIGCFQCLALWPGFSRSAATIMGGMILGARRTMAAEYSFIAAVPIMIAASGLELVKNLGLFTSSDMMFLATGFVVSFFSAWAAIKFFIALLGKTTLRPFAYYRLALAPLVLLFWSTGLN
ncbi:Undecaprenyl-diphosphatase [Desulfocurvibacter africanus PCS]|uniref:Undecaprenyl-diphosphatase n=1 Tax=Desulfocurvibacter africanus PCS TaxID=1262666 RepID=M5PX05_DESAF|nr:undecaprenyl-diphosphate phosphatase [Desulfocurvibacter africanus]EMG38857.1 Undecaprenyl-diphosphatase [Desulfocurvibacter africanus PCS]